VAPRDVPRGESCLLCGRTDFTLGVPRDQAIKATFTEGGALKGSGEHVCLWCASTVTNTGRRLWRFLITKDKTLLNGEVDIGRILLSPPEPPFLLGIGNGKKHIIYHCRVTVSKDLIYVYDAKRGKLAEVNRRDAISLCNDLARLAAALKSTCYGAAKASFGQKRLATLSPEDAALYRHTMSRHAFESDTMWAALELERANRKPGKHKKPARKGRTKTHGQ
jgi:CRISPR type IV-associated protein Csf1